LKIHFFLFPIFTFQRKQVFRQFPICKFIFQNSLKEIQYKISFHFNKKNIQWKIFQNYSKAFLKVLMALFVAKQTHTRTHCFEEKFRLEWEKRGILVVYKKASNKIQSIIKSAKCLLLQQKMQTNSFGWLCEHNLYQNI
jgi:hypothetical protein